MGPAVDLSGVAGENFGMDLASLFRDTSKLDPAQLVGRCVQFLDEARQSPSPPQQEWCRRAIKASPAEVFRAVKALRQGLDKTARTQLEGRMERYVRQVAPSFGLRLGEVGCQCPFFDSGGCLLKDARPLLCHAAVDGSDRARVAAVRAGLADSLGQRGLSAPELDFARAVGLGLSDPKRAEEWLKGGQAYLGAEWRDDRPETEPATASQPVPPYTDGEEPTGNPDLRGLARAQFLAHADGSFEEALAAAQGDHPMNALFRARVPLSSASEDEIDEWRARFERALDEIGAASFDPREAFDGLQALRVHDLSYHQRDDRALMEKVGALCHRIASEALPDLCAPITSPRRSGKPRVGFIGTSLRHGSSAPWTLGWIRNLGPTIETFAFHLHDRIDLVTLEFQKAAGSFYHVPSNMPVPQAARFIRSLDLDLLVYPDVWIGPRNHQFACLRLARNQAAAWGSPETTGLPTMDFFLSGELMETVNAEAQYSEKLVRLSGSGVCFERQDFPDSGAIREDFSPPGTFIVCLQHAPKFAPRWDGLWKDVCQATGQPIFVVDKQGLRSAATYARMERAGVRLRKLPYLGMADYFSLIKCADVIVDTPGWNGGITTLHAIQSKAAVVTLPTQSRRGRQSYCFLHQAGAAGLIANDEADFVSLVADADRRREAMRKMSPNAPFGDKKAAKSLAQFVQSLV